jgi:hypothetical protein
MADRLDRIRPKLDALRRACWAIRDRWSESDAECRRVLWERLHQANRDMDESLLLFDDEARRAEPRGADG